MNPLTGSTLSLLAPQPRLSVGGVAAVSQGKPLALMAYLACAPLRTTTRANLLSLLWADLEPDAAKHALRQTLWYVKKKTGADLILADGDTLRLAREVTVDRDEILEASHVGDHDRVVTLYGGPFLPNFATPGGAAFEEWAALERRRLLEVFRHAAESIIHARLASGHAREAIDLARRLRDQDLLNERGWQLLIEACLSASDQLAARAEAEALLELAQQEQLELEPATRALVRSARTQMAGSSAPDGLSGADEAMLPSLVGREQAFASLLTAFEVSRGGNLVRIHITARAGIGKSRLLRDFAARLRGMRVKVVQVGGALGTRELDLAFAGDLVGGLATLPGKHAVSTESAATLVDLNPSLSTYFDRQGRSTAGGDSLRRRVLALRELLRAVSFEHPIALLLDDLHWWDAASVALLAAALEGITESKILLVTAGRPEVRTSPMVAGPSTRHVTLDPLSAGHMEEMLLSIAGLPTADWATSFPRDVWRASRGSPLLALELLQYLEEQHLLSRVSGGWEARRPDMLAAVLKQGDVLEARLRELDRADLWLIVLLATSGTPLGPDVIGVAARLSDTELSMRLDAIESKGLVTRTTDGWRVAHDEIADAAMRVASADAGQRAAADLGRALSQGDPADVTRTKRAMQLLRGGDDVDARAELLRRYAGRRYEVGDRRPVAALASELLGASAPLREVRALARTAPLSWRLGLVSRLRRGIVVAGVATLAVLSVLASMPRRSVPPPDAVLATVFVDAEGRLSYETVDLRLDAWNPLDTLVGRPWRGPDIQLETAAHLNVDYSPVSSTLITSQSVSDSGIIDLFLHEPGREPRRFLPAKRDDTAPSFSPDGRLVAFSTARWDTLYRYDIAIAAIGDSTPRQLTSGPASDGRPVFSPDGTRIAFGRSNWGQKPNEVCVIDLASTTESCLAIPQRWVDPVPLGWLDRDRILIYQSLDKLADLGIVQWSTRELTPLPSVGSGELLLSPDGKWVSCICATAGDGQEISMAYPLAAPSLLRPIRPSRRDGRVYRSQFWLSSRATVLAASLRIEAPRRIHTHIGTQLWSSVRDQAGNLLTTFGSVRWHVLDTAAGSVDSVTGLVRGSGKRDSITVVARAGALVTDTVVMAVEAGPARVALDETWTDLSRWSLFGLPTPGIDSSRRDGRVFLNNGDGSFTSGAVSQVPLDGRLGAGIEAMVQVPITLPQWQLLSVSFVRLRPQDTRVTADGNASPFVVAGSEVCGVSYPREGRGSGLASELFLSGRSAWARIPHENLLGGRWQKLRLQLFPDGRCGVAIDDRPLGIINSRLSDASELHARLAGNSYATRIAVGRLRAWEGVPADLDWSKARVLK